MMLESQCMGNAHRNGLESLYSFTVADLALAKINPNPSYLQFGPLPGYLVLVIMEAGISLSVGLSLQCPCH